MLIQFYKTYSVDVLGSRKVSVLLSWHLHLLSAFHQICSQSLEVRISWKNFTKSLHNRVDFLTLKESFGIKIGAINVCVAV